VKRLAAFLILLFCLVAFGGRSLADSGDAGETPTQREALEPKNAGSEFLKVVSWIPECVYVCSRTGSFDNAPDAPTCTGAFSTAPPVGRVSCKRCVYDTGQLLRVSHAGLATKAIPCASFRADTLVLMADGTKKPIGDVAVGDKVVATDPSTGRTSVRTVTRLFTHIDDDLLDLVVLTDDGVETIHTTDHHRFWNDTTKAWVEAADLKSGERLLTADGDVVTVGVLKRVPGAAPMLDLTVEYDHTFYVALNDTAVLVHNQTCLNAAARAKVSALRSGADVEVGSAAEARALLDNMPEVRAHVETNPYLPGANAGPGTYRGDLINTANPSAPIHQPQVPGVKAQLPPNHPHNLNPHYNIIFPDGTKAAIVIKG
jgi:hypothetical protein